MGSVVRGWIRALILAAIAAMVPGCLAVRGITMHYEYDKENGYGTLVQTYYDIRSDEKDEAGRQSDFSELIDMWKGDAELAERASDGLYVKRREVTVEGGVLVGRMTALFESFADLDFETLPRGVLRSKWIGSSKEFKVKTNGRIEDKVDSLRITWPAGTNVLEIEMMGPALEPSDFVRRFEDWSRGHR